MNNFQNHALKNALKESIVFYVKTHGGITR
jgi:hypothetical protein